MNDTPQHIKELQLKNWLSKPPMERLKQMMIDNEALSQFLAVTRRIDGSSQPLQIGASPKQPPHDSTH